MFKKLINFVILAIAFGIAFFLHLEYKDPNITKAFYSIASIAIAYLFLKILLEEMAIKFYQY